MAEIQWVEHERIREILHRQILDAVSHDLKTPLAAIIGSLEVHEQRKKNLSTINKHILIRTALAEAYRLDHFISNILDMAKLENNRVKVKSELCSIAQVIDGCLIRLGFRNKLCQIDVLSQSQDIFAIIDHTLLSRALGLVLDNAVRHSGAQPAITIRYGIEGANCFIRVYDNGPGIPPGREHAIFNKYMRLERSDRQNAGTGLGLAICQHIMQLLSGSIVAENRDDTHGAVLTFMFPYNPTALGQAEA